jgi:hypothetical protein
MKTKFISFFKKYSKLLPLLILVIFLYQFIHIENNLNRQAFEGLAAEKQHIFNKLYEVAPLFQTEDSVFQAIADGRKPISILSTYAFINYDDIIMDIIDTPYTMAVLDKDREYLESIIPQLNHFNWTEFIQDTTTIHNSVSYYDQELGYTNIYIYKTSIEDKYWLFRVTDGNLIKNETNKMALLVTLLMAITAIINLYYIYKFNKN